MATPPGSALDYFGLCATKHEPKELDPGFHALLKQVSAQEKANLAAGGIKQQMDYCYTLWGEMEDIFKEKHGIRWRSPAKQNTDLIYDND